MSAWHPKIDDIWPYIKEHMERAYQQRERPQCSRADFFDGYLAALRDQLPRSAFRPGHFEPDDTTPPTPHGGR